MTAGTFNFTVELGATFLQTFRWKDKEGDLVDLSGYTARMHIRRYVNSESPEVILTTENGRITLGGADGTITLSLSAAETSAVDIPNGVYDLELESADGHVTRLLEGTVTFSREVTRDDNG